MLYSLKTCSYNNVLKVYSSVANNLLKKYNTPIYAKQFVNKANNMAKIFSSLFPMTMLIILYIYYLLACMFSYVSILF